MRPVAPLVLALLLLAAASARGEEWPTWPERVASARRAGPDGIVLALPDRPGGEPAPCVRVERDAEISTALDHLAAAPATLVLLLPSPAPELGRLTVVRGNDAHLVVFVTEHGFRAPERGGRAYTFRSPALLRWALDRLTAPDRRLAAGASPADVAPRVAAFQTATAALGASAPATAGELVRNGSFEEALTGKASPIGWDRMDGLTSFWVLDAVDPARHGHVVALDTDVYEHEWKRRQEEMAKDSDLPPWPKTPVPEKDQYATVGGNHGVSVYSEAMPVEAGRPYRLRLAFRTDLPQGTAKVWVRGYGALENTAGPEERRLYDALVTLRMGSPGWKTHTMVFHPTKNTPAVARMRVMLYGYWPRGRYAFDDVSVVPISDDEYARAKATERSDVK